MVHITVAVARFVEILLFDIARTAAGLLGAGLLIIAACVGALIAVRRIARRRRDG